MATKVEEEFILALLLLVFLLLNKINLCDNIDYDDSAEWVEIIVLF